MKFLSEANEMMHRGELVRMKHRRSIFEKSYGMEFKTPTDVQKARIPNGEREILFKLICDIKLHEVFFSSFNGSVKLSDELRKRYGSEASFLFELYECAKAADGGFLIIFKNDRGKVSYNAGRDYMRFLKREPPCLALDLEEHAYFYDYLFERDRYIKSALSEFDLSKI